MWKNTLKIICILLCTKMSIYTHVCSNMCNNFKQYCGLSFEDTGYQTRNAAVNIKLETEPNPNQLESLRVPQLDPCDTK